MLTWGRQSSWAAVRFCGKGFPQPAAEAEVFALGAGERSGRGVRGCECRLHLATRPQRAHPWGQLQIKPPHLAPGVGSR